MHASTKFRFSREKLYVSFLVVISFLVTIYWVKGSIIVMNDGFFPFDPFNNLSKDLLLWNNNRIIATPYNNSFEQIPYIVTLYISYSVLHLPLWFGQYFYISLLQFLSSYGIYRLALYYVSRFRHEADYFTEVAAITAALFYEFNFYKDLYIGGDLYASFILVELFPLFAYFSLKFLDAVNLHEGAPYLAFLSITASVMAGGYWEGPFLFLSIIAVIVLIPILSRNGIRNVFTLRYCAMVAIFVGASSWVYYALFIQSLASITGNLNAQQINGISTLANQVLADRNIYLLNFLSSFLYGLPSLSGGIVGYPISSLVRSNIFLLLTSFSPFFIALLYLTIYRETDKYLGFIYLSTGMLMSIGFVPNFGNGSLLDIFVVLVEFSLTGLYIGFFLLFILSLVLFLFMFDVSRFKQGTEFASRSSIKRVREINSVLIYICVIFIIINVLISAYNPMEQINTQGGYVANGTYKPSNNFIDAGKFLNKNAGEGNVLFLPITVGPTTIHEQNSTLSQVQEPLASYVKGNVIYRDPGLTTSSFAYPIIETFPYVSNTVTSYLSCANPSTFHQKIGPVWWNSSAVFGISGTYPGEPYTWTDGSVFTPYYYSINGTGLVSVDFNSSMSSASAQVFAYTSIPQSALSRNVSSDYISGIVGLNGPSNGGAYIQPRISSSDGKVLWVGTKIVNNSLAGSPLNVPIQQYGYFSVPLSDMPALYNGTQSINVNFLFNIPTENNYSYNMTVYGIGVSTQPVNFDIFGNFTNYVRSLGVDYIVVNTNQSVSWSQPLNSAAESFPFNFRGILGRLNSTNGITLSAKYGGYYIYKVINPLSLIYPSQGTLAASNSSLSPELQTYDFFATGHNLAGKNSLIFGGFNNRQGSSNNVNLNWLSNGNSFTVKIRSDNWSYIIFDRAFSNFWIMKFSNGTTDNYHFMANGRFNSWWVPPGNYTVVIYTTLDETQLALNLVTLGSVFVPVFVAIIVRVKRNKI